MEKKDLKIGITLSGGGIRASTFHLGILARLAEDNLLEKIRMISTVSGGSLVTGLIYKMNNNKWPTSFEYKTKCLPLIKKCITEQRLQSHALFRMAWLWPALWKGRAYAVALALEHCWGLIDKLNDIPQWPRWYINSTTIESGKSWRFIPNNRMGDYLLNYVKSPDIKLSEALCSSAAVPFLISSYKLHADKYEWFKYDEDNKNHIKINPPYKRIRIWDGGAYDNLGIEPLVKYDNGGGGMVYRDEFNFLIVSDAAMEIKTNQSKWYRTNIMRLLDVTADQVRALRARSLCSHFENKPNSGAYFKIGDTAASIKDDFKRDCDLFSNNYDDNQIERLKFYPTTLRKLEIEDFDSLYNHGWEVANASLVCWCPDLFENKGIK